MPEYTGKRSSTQDLGHEASHAHAGTHVDLSESDIAGTAQTADLKVGGHWLLSGGEAPRGPLARRAVVIQRISDFTQPGLDVVFFARRAATAPSNR